MTRLQSIDTLDSTGLASLIDEIRRYLEAVDTFRREGQEPRWLPEGFQKEVLR